MYPFKPHFVNVLLKRRLSVFISANEFNLSRHGAGAEVLGPGLGNMGPFRKLQICISLRNSSRNILFDISMSYLLSFYTARLSLKENAILLHMA